MNTTPEPKYQANRKALYRFQNAQQVYLTSNDWYLRVKGLHETWLHAGVTDPLSTEQAI